MFSLLFLITTSYATDKNCLWHDSYGYIYDISKLHNINNYQVPDTDTSMGMFNMIYEFNFCTGAVRCQGRDVAAFEALEVMGKVTENCDVLGLKETQEFGYVNPVYPELGFSITYKQGDMCFDVKDDGGLQKIIADNEQMQMSPRSVTFEITCGKDEPNFRVIDSSKCNIRLGIQHSAGCRSGSSPSGDSSTLLLYFILAAGLYFGGGIAYNKKKYQLSGVDALPHSHFWRDFPHLVKDGINFTVIKVFGMIKKFRGLSSEGGYAVI